MGFPTTILNAHRTRFLVLNVSGLAVFASAWVSGWAQIPFTGDETRLTWFIAAAFMSALYFVWKQDWRSVQFIAGSLVLLGLIGTVIGFIMALIDIDPAKAADIAEVVPMVKALLRGMGTAFYTTLVGSVGFLWVTLNAHLLGKDDETGD